ncbi:fungal-specific transcription factor domain-containing protein [Colletotrichum lupini]|nr:fungal-specific transcription factor domain-containing protein [Colletotrichum lupini]
MAGNGTRSRTGCLDCRRRKRRCDEGKPKCASCRRHGVVCVYVKSSQSSPSKFLLSVASGHFIAPLESPASDSFVNLRSDELALVCQQYADGPGGVLPSSQEQLMPALSWLPKSSTLPGGRESMMVQYYFEVISNSRVYVPSERNLFRTCVMPVLLSSSGPLFSTVLALSAAEMVRRTPQDGVDYAGAAIRYKINALTQLQSKLNTALEAEENLLTCVLQASLEIAEGSRPSWLRHLRGALAIMDNHGDWITPECAALALQYFRFRYVLMKTTGCKAPHHDGQTDDCDEAIQRLERLLPGQGTFQTIDPQIGCSMELVQLISMISAGAQKDGGYTEEGSRLERRIRELDCSAESMHDDYLVKSAECFRFAALIYLQLIVYGATVRTRAIPHLLQTLLGRLGEVIVEDQPRRSFPMWPLFIAGCVSSSDAHRKAVLDLFNLLDSKWPIGNISTVKRVVWTIWQTRDFDGGGATSTDQDWQEIIDRFGWKLSLS